MRLEWCRRLVLCRLNECQPKTGKGKWKKSGKELEPGWPTQLFYVHVRVEKEVARSVIIKSWLLFATHSDLNSNLSHEIQKSTCSCLSFLVQPIHGFFSDGPTT